MASLLDISDLKGDKNYISLGKIKPEIITFLKEKVPNLISKIDSNTEIIFWKDRLKHTELHKKDFQSDNEFYNCLEKIPTIIQEPDYIGIHPKDNSISFIKDFSSHIIVAVRISSTGILSYRTMYPLMDAQLTHYIDKGYAWKWNKKT